MPKLCIGCNETKSKSLFYKGRVVCKECDKDKGTSITASTIGEDVDVFKADEGVGVLAKVDVIYNTIPKILQRLDALEDKLTETKKLEDISTRLGLLEDMFAKSDKNISTKLDLLENASKKLVTANALRSLSTKLVLREPPPDVEEPSESCIAM